MGASRRDLALWVVCSLLIGLGIWLRARQLGTPEGLTWDERHFVDNARNYLAGRADWNDHPPLGKLFIAQGIRWFGDDAFAWRFSALVFGLASIVIAGVLGGSLFSSHRAGLLAAAFVAGDGFFIAYSRSALLDGVVASFVLAIACAVVLAKRAWHVALACVLLGLGCSVKLNALVMVVPILIATLVSARAPRWSAAFLLLAPLAYWIVYARGLALAGQSHGPGDVWRASSTLIGHHLALSEGTHPLISRWYTWLLPLRPISMRFDQQGDVVRTMSCMGNTLLWWASSASVLHAALRLGKAVVASARTRGERKWNELRALDRRVLWLLLLWFLPVFPWMVSSRDSYVYHYLPAYGFGLVLVAGHLHQAFEARRRAAWIALGGVTLLSLWMAPVWSEIPVSRTGYALRLWFPGWRRVKRKPTPVQPSTSLLRPERGSTLGPHASDNRRSPRSAPRCRARLARGEGRARERGRPRHVGPRVPRRLLARGAARGG
jgi:dolichyl-phosphate-mannose-protein mannosyltransferase